MKKHFLTAVAIAAAIVIAHAPAARSAEKAPAEKAPAKNGLTQDLMKVSDDGYSAIRAIHLARIAIFNGDTKTAKEMLDKAKKDLDAATKDAQTFAADNKAADQGKKADDKSASDKMDLIPIDGEIAIADTFVPSPEKKKHIDKANEHLKSGHSKEAIEELRLGEVDVVFTPRDVAFGIDEETGRRCRKAGRRPQVLRGQPGLEGGRRRNRHRCGRPDRNSDSAVHGLGSCVAKEVSTLPVLELITHAAMGPTRAHCCFAGVGSQFTQE